MKGSGRRRDLRGLWGAALVALPMGISSVLGGPAPPAQSLVSVCGYVQNHALISTSVPVGTYCVDADDPRCRPSFPAVGVSVSVTGSTVAQAFVCVHWDN